MIVIGITGTLGAGKGTIVDYLVEKMGFAHFSVREYLIEEIERRGMPVNRDSMVVVANDLRKRNSPSFVVDELYKRALESGNNCVIESIRTPGEVESLRSKGLFYLFATDADPKVRYERIFARQSETDHIDFETFIENEKREMDTDDPSKQNLRRSIEMADFIFQNDGSIKDLNHKVEAIISRLLIKNH